MLNLTSSLFGLFLTTLSIIGYGNYIYNQKKNNDLFFIIIVGYLIVGSIVLFLHFFLPINNLISWLIISIGIILLFYSKFDILNKKFLLSLLILIIINFILLGFAEHPIDANMYHHAYVSYLKSEKIIYSIANIEYRFGHISLLQYVQSAFVNNLIIPLNLSSLNIIFFTFFLLFCYEIIFAKEQNKFVFLLVLFLSCFVMIKMGRYREYGNDLIPFLVGCYFLIKIFNEKLLLKNISKVNLFSFLPIFSSFMISHKVTYFLTSLIFFSLISKKNILLALKQKYLIIFFILFTSLWLLKSFFETSCLIYPVLETCFKNTGWYLKGAADPKNAMWLSEVWAKGFIDHPEWQGLNLDNYIQNFNWISTWLNNHFIKILEKLSPLILIMLLSLFYILKHQKNFYDKINLKRTFINQLYFILVLISIGLLVWFIKSPLFRYGAFYIVSFLCILFLIITSKMINNLNFKKLKNLRYIFIVSILFFLAKNINRQINSETDFFPLTKPSINNYNILYENPKILSPMNLGVCYYTDYICSHEVPDNLKIINKKNYFEFK